jgi:hypothetical protein
VPGDEDDLLTQVAAEDTVIFSVQEIDCNGNIVTCEVTESAKLYDSPAGSVTVLDFDQIK